MIKVPKTPRSAFNPDRPIDGLIQAHVKHFQEVTGEGPRRKPRTEGEAADYLARMSQGMYDEVARPRAKKKAKKKAKKARPVKRSAKAKKGKKVKKVRKPGKK